MARPLRIEYEHALYHVMSRGHRKENIFFNDRDREVFIKKLHESLTKYSVILYCFCLMDNHYHLLIETPSPNLSAFMHYLNASYSNYINAKYKLTGSLFQGRYKSILVEDDSYLLTLSTYIHLNPLRAKLVDDLTLYPWSSYHDYINEEKVHPFVTTDIVRGQLPNYSYESFILQWYNKNQRIDKTEIYGSKNILGSDTFREKITNMVFKMINNQGLSETEHPMAKRLTSLTFKDIQYVFKDHLTDDCRHIFEKYNRSPYRKLFIWALKHFTELKNEEIGEIFNLHYTMVSEINKVICNLCKHNPHFKYKKEQIEQSISNLKKNYTISKH